MISYDTVYNLQQYFCQSTKHIQTIQKKNMVTRIIKNISNKMKGDVGMSKLKKHANKVRWDPKLNKPLPHNPT